MILTTAIKRKGHVVQYTQDVLIALNSRMSAHSSNKTYAKWDHNIPKL